MKPKILLGLVGLPRSFKETANNLFTNLINPNIEKYDFSIVINTDDTYINTHSRTNKLSTVRYNTREELEVEFKNIYSPYLKNITYSTYENILYSDIPFSLYLIRINKIIQESDINSYDYYIFMRFDVIILNPINMDNYFNTFSIITSIINRDGLFFNQDWEQMLISHKNPFFLYIYYYNKFWNKYSNTNNYSIYKHTMFIDKFDEFKSIEYRELTQNEIDYIRIKGNITGTFDSDLWKAVYILIINNYNFIPEQNTIFKHKY